jgi:hypothetical protein
MDAWDEGVPATALREISVLKEVRGVGGRERGREGAGVGRATPPCRDSESSGQEGRTSALSGW